jgi:hypothetical protein
MQRPFSAGGSTPTSRSPPPRSVSSARRRRHRERPGAGRVSLGGRQGDPPSNLRIPAAADGPPHGRLQECRGDRGAGRRLALPTGGPLRRSTRSQADIEPTVGRVAPLGPVLPVPQHGNILLGRPGSRPPVTWPGRTILLGLYSSPASEELYSLSEIKNSAGTSSGVSDCLQATPTSVLVCRPHAGSTATPVMSSAGGLPSWPSTNGTIA